MGQFALETGERREEDRDGEKGRRQDLQMWGLCSIQVLGRGLRSRFLLSFTFSCFAVPFYWCSMDLDAVSRKK